MNRRSQRWEGLSGRARGQGVVVNLRFDDAAAWALGVEGHVCELQLTTRAFAARAQVECGKQKWRGSRQSDDAAPQT